MLEAYLSGLGVGAGLIIAIGSQNAFVLRQGLRGEYVNLVCLTCAVSDAILIALGVMGFQKVVTQITWLEPTFLYLGAAFLMLYGIRNLYTAFTRKEGLLPMEGQTQGWPSVLGICLALTWLNPHVYLDTLFLLGAVSTRFMENRIFFAAGAMSASFAFFFALGHGAALLRPFFAKPRSWQVLDFFVGVVMLMIAAKLLLSH